MAIQQNEITRVEASRILLATFTNNEGLIALSQNNFAAGVNSGDPTVVLASDNAYL